MQNEWWYSVNGRRAGPISADDLRQLLVDGAIEQSTLVWKEGLSDWLPIFQVDILATLLRSLPPELPKILPIEDVSVTTAAGPWRRLFARLIDLWLLSIPTALGAAYVSTSAYPEFAVWIQRPGSDYAFGWLLLPLVLAVEALVFSVSGTTPGKALLSIAVYTPSGGPLSFIEYFQRQIRLYWFGLGTGFPLISLFTMARQRSRLKAGKEATYDEKRGILVRAKRLTFARGVSASLAIAALIVLNALLQMPQRSSSIAVEQRTDNSQVQEHPTKSPTYDAKGWTQENTDSKEFGPWLQYDPPGTRYCRYHDGTIQRLYPPGLKPNAEKANVFCLPGSTLNDLSTESQRVDKSQWPVCKGMFDDLVPNAKCRPSDK